MTGPILVTGASGFVGRQVVRALVERGLEVHGAGRGPFDRPGMTHHRIDLFDEAATARLLREVRPSHVLHAAWYADHGSFWDAPANWKWVDATMSLAIAAQQCGVTRFVGIGSVAEYDWSHGRDGPLAESAPLLPATMYGDAKLSAAKAAAAILRGSSFAWARLFHLVGAGEPAGKVTSYIAKEFAEGRIPALRQPDSAFDFIDAAYAGNAIAALLLSAVEGAVNIGRGEATSLQHLSALIGRQAGRDGPYAPPPSSGSVPLTLVADVTRLRNEVGMPPPARLANALAYLAPATEQA